MTESSPPLQITVDMTWCAVSPVTRLTPCPWSPEHIPDKTPWQPGDDISMIGAQQDPGHNLCDVDNLSSVPHAARVITRLPRCNDNTQQVSSRPSARVETKHPRYCWSLAANLPTSLSAIADWFSVTCVHWCCLMTSLTSHESTGCPDHY